MKNLKAIILAAGEGSRMKSKKPKVLHEIMHKRMIDYVLDAAKHSGAQSMCIVVGHQAEQVQSAIEREDVSFAMQTERKGTGHAVKMAGAFIEDDQDILILCGDTPLITGETLQHVVKFHQQEQNSVTVVSAMVDDATGYGRIIRDAKGAFLKSVEDKDASEAERAVKEINTGIYIFAGAQLKAALDRLKNDNAQGEYYLPDCLEILLSDGQRVGAYTAADAGEFVGVNSRMQLADAAELMKKRINRRHMENGVTIADPSHTYIGSDVVIGQDSVILPGCVIEGNTVIGADCVIGPNSRLTDMRLHDGVTFQTSTAMESEIGSNTTVGPFAYIRPNCQIGENVKIGDFVEVKNSNVGNGTKIPHLSYVGDTDAGEKINFGCGSIMVNYDGEKKHRTTIGDHVFVGCNVNLVAPVTIAENSYIAAGSTITRDVPADVLAVARARQTVINGWKEKRIRKKDEK